MTRELRYVTSSATRSEIAYQVRELEMRARREEDRMIIEGYPIVYGAYANFYGFRETIDAGAARAALERSDEIVLWNHDAAKPMARRSNGTLEASEDEHGVFIRADVSGSVWGRAGHEAIENQLTVHMSFAFEVAEGGERWVDEDVAGVKIPTRHITEFGRLFDYSPVSFPAYEDTEVQVLQRELALKLKPEPAAVGEEHSSTDEQQLMRRQRVLSLEEASMSILRGEEL